jgi:FixJ family two-component response regulator
VLIPASGDLTHNTAFPRPLAGVANSIPCEGIWDLTVYILEDDSAVCDALCLFAEQMGHSVKSFSDAESFFAAGVPAGSDTVIVDIGLPGIDGSKVIAWLYALAEPPRVLAITGQSHTMIRDVFDVSPVTDLLRKPLSANELALYL